MFFLILSVFIYSKDSLFWVNNQLKSSLTKVSSNADYSCSTTASRRTVDLPCEVPNDNSTCEYETIDGGKVAKTCYWIVATNVYVSYSTVCSMWALNDGVFTMWNGTTSESPETLEEYISQSKMCSVEFNPCDASKDPQCSINNDPEDPTSDPEDGDKKINDPVTDPNDCNYKWGECKLIWMWSPTGKISCKQTGELIYSPEWKTCPASAENEVFISMNLDSPSADCNNTYANDKDICNVKVWFTIDWQLKWWKEIAWKWQSSKSMSFFKYGNGFLADRTVLSTQWEKALSFWFYANCYSIKWLIYCSCYFSITSLYIKWNYYFSSLMTNTSSSFEYKKYCI